VLLAKDGSTLGIANVVRDLPAPATVNGSIAVIRPFGMESRYLMYVLRGSAIQEWIAQVKDGMGVPHLFQADIKKFPLPLPPESEQQRIADFLDDQVARIDSIVTARQQQIALLQQEQVALTRQAVAGGILGTKTRESGIPWIGRVSHSAQILSLARIVTLQRGVDLTAEERRDGPFPVVTTAGVVGHHDVAIETGPGVVIGRYGSAGSVYWINADFWPHNTTLYVRDFHGNDRRWCYYLLKSYPYEMLQARAAVPGINRNDMAPDPMPWVPLPDQQAAVAFLDAEVEQFDLHLGALASMPFR
jgi:type I restriction enzyme S subunit